MPVSGWESVTVPGAVAAWKSLSARFGKLQFASLFEPALDYASNGFAVSPTIAELWRRGGELHRAQPGFAEHFLPGGRSPAPGEIFVNHAIARSLEAIADSRGEAFYRGALGARIAAAARQHGAALCEDDLADHSADWCGTVSSDFRGVALHEIPPNGQGIAALMALGILAHTEIDELAPESTLALHLQIEAMKLAFADVNRFVADPAHMTVTSQAMLDPAYLLARADLIDRRRASDPDHGAPQRGGTVYLSAADASGMMVSYIQSNYMGFGSGVVVPGTGIHMQDRGAGFSLETGHPNRVGPGKRPFHTIIPGFAMKDGAPLMSFGVMGGPMQAQGHVQMVLRTQLYGQNPQTASDAPRWRFIQGREVAVESAMPVSTIDGLQALGHLISIEAPDNAFGFGGAQLVHRLGDGHYVAGSDHRKDGQAAGF
jgi:gamma-glutamyltranspeptidase / glutathione hydrolase